MSNIDEEKKLQGSPTNGYTGGQEEQAGCFRRTLLAFWNEHKKAIIIIFISNLIVGVGCYFLGRHMALNNQRDAIECPPDWIGYQGHCNKLSEDEKNWYESQKSCISQNASLARIAEEETDLTKKIIGGDVFWIGLKNGPPWKWLDGDNATLEVKGHGGDCAYLDDSGKAYAGNCFNEHRYICKKNEPMRS